MAFQEETTINIPQAPEHKNNVPLTEYDGD